MQVKNRKHNNSAIPLIYISVLNENNGEPSVHHLHVFANKSNIICDIHLSPFSFRIFFVWGGGEGGGRFVSFKSKWG